MNKSIKLCIYLAIFVFTACNNSQNNPKNSVASNDTTIIKELTIKWNDFLVKKDLQNLKTLYAEQVSIYGTLFSKEQAISNKQDLYKNHSNFEQSITGEIRITKITDLKYEVKFQKHSSYNGKISEVKGYLIFDKLSDIWKITNESDELTDKNITKLKSQETQEPSTCIDVIMEILVTSPLYLELTKGLEEAVIKNGGTSFGITVEGSPNPKMDGAMDISATYDFSIHETYSDRFVTFARFTFNPAERKLYENKVGEGGVLYQIDFDKKLLVKFNEICN